MTMMMMMMMMINWLIDWMIDNDDDDDDEAAPIGNITPYGLRQIVILPRVAYVLLFC